MRRLVVLLLPALILAACGGGVPGSTPTPAQLAAEPAAPPTLPPPPSPTLSHDQFYSIDFVSPDVGWAAGADGIFATRDGGAHWTQQYHASGAYGGEVDFVDANAGFALSRYGFMSTRDGGEHWDVISSTASDAPLHIDFTSADAGWAIYVRKDESDVAVFHVSATGDPLQDTAIGTADSVCFGDVQYGWSAGASGVAHTVDGGTTWVAMLERPLPNWGENHPWKDTIRCAGRDVAWVLFIGGIAASHEAYAVYRTVDGGAHWEPVVQAPIGPALGTHVGAGAYPGPIAVLDANDVWVVGACGPCDDSSTTTVEATHDGGRTWAPPVVIPGAGPFPHDLQFIDPQHGWLATSNGIFATTDAGRTWVKQR